MFQKLAFVVIALLVLSVQFGSAENYVPGNATTAADSVNCNMCHSTTFVTNNLCFCDSEADKLLKCLKGANPAWPNLPIDPAVENAQCPSPVTDPTGFQTCLDNKTPKRDPNADTIFNNCMASTGAKTDTSAATTLNPFTHARISLLMATSLFLAWY